MLTFYSTLRELLIPDQVQYELQPVPEALYPLVKSAFGLQINAFSSIPVLLLPDPSAYLTWTKMAEGSHRCKLVGPRSVALRIDRRRRTKTCLIRLNPGAVQRILGIPANELCDQSISMAETWLSDFERVDSSEDPWRILENITPGEGITRPQMLVDAFCRKAPEQATVRSIARDLGVSDRYLRKQVLRHIGLSPKKVQRIARMFGALHLRTEYEHWRWAELAAAAGYVDQSHMIAEFQELLGASPTAVFS